MIMEMKSLLYKEEKMSRNIRERRLRLWKIRQEAKGYDVSKVKTLEDAERFNQLKRKPRLKKDESVAEEVVHEETEQEDE